MIPVTANAGAGICSISIIQVIKINLISYDN